MAVIEYDAYKQKLHAMDDTIANLYKALEIESSKHEIERLLAEAEEEGFWNDVERSQKNQVQLKQLQSKVQRYDKLVSEREDLLALVDMGTEMDDESLLPELYEGYAELEYTGADPTLGYCHLISAGTNGVKIGEGSKKYKVLKVDTATKTVGFIL